MQVAAARRQPHRPEVDRLDPVRIRAGCADGDLGRGAADVADRDPLGQRDVGGEDGAAVGERALLLLRQHARAHAGRARERRDELGGVRRLPTGCGEEDVERTDALAARDLGHPADRLRRCGDVNGRDVAEPFDLLAERKAHLRLVDGNEPTVRAAAWGARDEQAGRVRTDVDDTDAHLAQS